MAILKCSGCLKPLCEVIKLERPLPPNQEMCVVAICPYCKDKSLPEYFNKSIGTSGYTVFDKDYPDGYREVTLVTKRSIVDNKLIIEVVECQENQKLQN